MNLFALIPTIILGLVPCAGMIYVFILLVKALRKYLHSRETMKEKSILK